MTPEVHRVLPNGVVLRLSRHGDKFSLITEISHGSLIESRVTGQEVGGILGAMLQGLLIAVEEDKPRAQDVLTAVAQFALDALKVFPDLIWPRADTPLN